MKRILYIEDDPINALVVKGFIGKIYDVTVTENAEEGIPEAETLQYDLILMDINLGKDRLTGIEALQILRKNEAFLKLPIIAVTAYALPEDRNRFLGYGFDEYVPKPINKEKFIALLESIF